MFSKPYIKELLTQSLHYKLTAVQLNKYPTGHFSEIIQASQLSMNYSYQDAATMGTHSSSEPLMRLELNLSVHVIYIKIPVTCENTEEKPTKDL